MKHYLFYTVIFALWEAKSFGRSVWKTTVMEDHLKLCFTKLYMHDSTNLCYLLNRHYGKNIHARGEGGKERTERN